MAMCSCGVAGALMCFVVALGLMLMGLALGGASALMWSLGPRMGHDTVCHATPQSWAERPSHPLAWASAAAAPQPTKWTPSAEGPIVSAALMGLQAAVQLWGLGRRGGPRSERHGMPPARGA